MTGYPAPKVPVEPLLDALNDAGIDRQAACDLAGVTYPEFWRDQNRGHLTVWKADRLAVRALNRHPVNIWGHQWLDQQALNDPVVDLRIRALHESWQLRQEVAS